MSQTAQPGLLSLFPPALRLATRSVTLGRARDHVRPSALGLRPSPAPPARTRPAPQGDGPVAHPPSGPQHPRAAASGKACVTRGFPKLPVPVHFLCFRVRGARSFRCRGRLEREKLEGAVALGGICPQQVKGRVCETGLSRAPLPVVESSAGGLRRRVWSPGREQPFPGSWLSPGLGTALLQSPGESKENEKRFKNVVSGERLRPGFGWTWDEKDSVGNEGDS